MSKGGLIECTGNVQDLTIDLFRKLSTTQRLRGGFGVWMRHGDLLDLKFLHFNLLDVVHPKPEG
jgi:hypothetical protein